MLTLPKAVIHIKFIFNNGQIPNHQVQRTEIRFRR